MFIDTNTAGQAGEATGRLLFPIVLIAVGIYFSNKLGKQRGTGFVWWPTILAVVACLVAFMGKGASG